MGEYEAAALTCQSDHLFRPLIMAVIAAHADAPDEWLEIGAPNAGSAAWLRLRHRAAATPAQGWKLHVSASAATAKDVLRRALPVLLAEPLAFKVAASADVLIDLNEGNLGPSQIGKFLVIYPTDEAQAARVAARLDTATDGLRGPRVPSDRPLRPGSLVHYRYGGFGDRHMQTPLGEVIPALLSPTGELVPDRRLPYYWAPEWAVAPFPDAETPDDSAPSAPLVAGRFLIVQTLHRSARGAVHLAVDLERAERCVLKRRWPFPHPTMDGVDLRESLRHEAAILARLAPDDRFPAVHALVENQGELYLALEDVVGDTFEQYLHQRIQRGSLLTATEVAAFGCQMASMLAVLHAHGLVYGDLKSANVVVGPSGVLRLIDFETVAAVGQRDLPYGRGTPGYMSPQRRAHAPVSPGDDIYALGALLYFAATGAEPSRAPDPQALLARPIHLFTPSIGSDLASVIARCLAPDQAQRWPTMAAVAAALVARDNPGAVSGPEPTPTRDCRPASEETVHWRELARRVGETLCTTAARDDAGHAAGWLSTHTFASGIRARDLGTGTAGTVVALAELTEEFNDPTFRRTMAEAAHWLATAPGWSQVTLPGLYVGEAGIGAALLRASQILDDDELRAAAIARGRLVASLPFCSPDLYNGTAGRLRFHLLLWDETGDAVQLEAAVAAGRVLCAAADDAGEGGVRWAIPPGYAGLSGQRNLGYAHGAAGIADALLDLYEVTADERLLDAAQRAARWLRRLAVPVLDDGRGLSWPVNEGEPPVTAFWCHGAAGIGRFFLHAAALDLVPGATEVARQAAWTVARTTRWASPTQCHGLAGNIEVLLDVYQATHEMSLLDEARRFARLLEGWAIERDGLLVWPSEARTVISPDYLVGYAGVAVCLLRLADPDRRPHQLSRRGFRWPWTTDSGGSRKSRPANAAVRQGGVESDA